MVLILSNAWLVSLLGAEPKKISHLGLQIPNYSINILSQSSLRVDGDKSYDILHC
jgi:hypothetical protein